MNDSKYEVLESWTHHKDEKLYALCILRMEDGNYTVRYVKELAETHPGDAKALVTFNSRSTDEAFLQGLIVMIRDLAAFQQT